jgi:hypothetical protein
MACPICKDRKVNPQPIPSEDSFKVSCHVCGDYKITRTAKNIAEGRTQLELEKLIYLIRDRHEFGSNIELDINILSNFPNSFNYNADYFSVLDRLLLFIAKKQGRPSREANIAPSDHPVIFSLNSSELNYYLAEASKLSFIENHGGTDYSLTQHGWKRVLDLKQNQKISNQAFIAMWFGKQVKTAWTDGIQPALEALGYDPLRIDMKEHNEKIDDQIIAEIRKSGLLIADFTGHREGVYFEAGFAMGLGIPVIWTCRKDHIDDVHFDTRQYNHIVWETPEDLKEKLTYRIEATIPNRPTPRKNI